MNNPLIEACVDSYASCMAADAGGADRFELCANLIIGGTTPSVPLFQQVKANSDVKINVLIRPRFGDFLYSDEEIDEMCAQIKTFSELGANGVVIGALKPDGTLDEEKMKRMIDSAGGIDITLHRAFDMSRDPIETLEKAISLGCNTILTSGQGPNVVAGKEVLKEVYAHAKGRIEIMAGAGVKKANIQEIHDYTGIVVFHTTGRGAVINSGMTYRKETVSMGLPSFSEYEIWQTNTDEFRECSKIVHALKSV
ncbi:copper homeostasis protein CutC [Tyzzerella sp. OttesenSCG-928-J15]|nr:copper homeostasis protein CutC [Tyzzerella sp. OttesenSCG-928-J15]